MRSFAWLLTLLTVLGCSSSTELGERDQALTGEQCLYFDAGGRVTICHATRSAKNPVIMLSVSTEACVEDHSEHAGDAVAVDGHCGPGACLPREAPCDATLPCCDGLTCSAGRCTAPCPSGQSLCDGVCRDVTTDPLACGTCGSVCGDGESCVDGTCTRGPDVTITSGGDGGISGPSVLFTYTTAEADATFECALAAGGGASFEPCPAQGQSYVDLAHGSAYTFSVRATVEGVTGQAATRTFVVDAQGPVIEIQSPVDGSNAGSAVVLAFTVDEQVELTCMLDGFPLAVCADGLTLTLTDGAHVLVISGVDAFGNVGTSSVSVTVDVSPPVITSITSTLQADARTQLRWTASDFSTIVDHYCRLDGGAFFACGSAETGMLVLDEAPASFEIYAVDEWGNAGFLDGDASSPPPSPFARR